MEPSPRPQDPEHLLGKGGDDTILRVGKGGGVPSLRQALGQSVPCPSSSIPARCRRGEEPLKLPLWPRKGEEGTVLLPRRSWRGGCRTPEAAGGAAAGGGGWIINCWAEGGAVGGHRSN